MGDMGYLDDEGFIYLIGRKKEILKYQNYHVSPVELENIINQIEGVKESCVVGVQSEDGNDVIYAVVRRNNDKLTELAVIEYVNGENENLFIRLCGD
jgi:4-coumarate--CoA ligase